MMKGSGGKAILRSEYTPYPWTVESLKLKFEIGDSETIVSSVISLSRKPDSDGKCSMELDGQDMELQSIQVDGRTLGEADYSLNPDKLIVHNLPSACTLEIRNRITPQENTALEGLYPSGQFLLTQCEA